ncbi:MAG: hypothetical protein LBK23_03525, partial [Oscillospiraceae bacterium]|nr:hypothetical protein [Oscillospiraceae bacterium]
MARARVLGATKRAEAASARFVTLHKGISEFLLRIIDKHESADYIMEYTVTLVRTREPEYMKYSKR